MWKEKEKEGRKEVKKEGSILMGNYKKKKLKTIA
jgi:hypothetical protein